MCRIASLMSAAGGELLISTLAGDGSPILEHARNLSSHGALHHMTHKNVIQITSQTGRLVAYQVGRVYALKTKHFGIGKAATRLDLLCAKLAMQRAMFSPSIRP